MRMISAVDRVIGQCLSFVALLAFLLFWVAPAAAEDPLAVELVEARSTAREVVQSLTGVIEADSVIASGFRVGGRISEILVEAGDVVAEGQALARIEATQQQLAVDNVRADVNAAQAELDAAQKDYIRDIELVERGSITRATLDEATRRRDIARAALDRSEAQLAQARSTLEDTVLRAPVDAVITTRDAEPGQVTNAGQTVVELAATGASNAVFLAPSVFPLEELIGRTIAVTLLDRPEAAPMRARIDEVSPLVDPATGGVRIKAQVVDTLADADFLGAAVQGRLSVTQPDVMMLPSSALVAGASGPAVWQFDPGTGRVLLKPIEIGSYTPDAFTVADGIGQGALIVGAGAQMLYPGRMVRAVSTAERALR